MQTNAPALPSVETIRRSLAEFDLTTNDKQVLQIQQYMSILLHWNDKINLTAIRDPREILYRHFCECMFAAVSVPLEKGRLADVGSGGGFPGIPLKIIRPELHVFLIESNLKKATFLAEVIRELELTDTRVLVGRYEELGEELAPLDFVCARALGEYAPFLEWAGGQHLGTKKVILWIGARDLPDLQKIRTWDWQEPVPVPQSLRRLLLVGARRSSVGAST
jgi:16S rRNA (guanine527-N7)-methyltransferase